MQTLFLLISAVAVFEVQASRILGIIPTPSYSHQIVFHPLWKKLSLRGHDVVLITTDPIRDPALTNLTEIDLAYVYKMVPPGLSYDGLMDSWGVLEEITKYSLAFSKLELEDAEVKRLIQDDSVKFDLVIFELLQPVFGAFAHKFGCPMIGVSSFDPLPEWLAAIGNAQSPVIFPNLILPYYKDLSFTQRLTSFVYQYIYAPLIQYRYANEYNKLINTHFGENYPPAPDYIKNIDMLFSNANPVFRINKPNVPAVIEFGGGVHLQSPEILPTGIKEFLDNSSRGVIYFSLGTHVNNFFIKDKLKDAFLEALDALPYDVLWKFDMDYAFKVPANVMVLKWFPQNDILGHRNVKAFITQCGLQSLEEALYNSVPVVGIPFFGDQARNAKMVEQLGIGMIVDKTKFSKDTFVGLVTEAITNPKYKLMISKLAKIANDQPMEGIDKLVWWTEYVIRHNGAKHLRSAEADVPLYQLYLLDVLAFLMVAASLLILIIFRVISYIVKLFIIKAISRKIKKE